ncbi:plastocyanin/azurin family copper-binding protein [Streptomyces sp. NPDC058297]|uniref:cupredoxin domain-containing protein n=1 Tax=Streptomyces sp. NPDC058297 TaxID=3346433 RepID=UPI0036E9911E
MPRLTTLVRVAPATLLLGGVFTVLDAPSAHAADHQVIMSGYAFSPRTLTITAGDTVTWVNQDSAPHDVKTTSGPEPSTLRCSTRAAPGATPSPSRARTATSAPFTPA